MKDRILVVDDDQDQLDLLEAMLRRLGFSAITRASARDALEAARTEDIDLVMTDIVMSDMDGLDLTERLRGLRPDVPVLLVTGHATIESAIAAMRIGAYDFLLKPVDERLLGLALARAVRHRRLSRELVRLQSSDVSVVGNERLVGKSEPMQRVLELVRRVSSSDASVLVYGETGTGKELIARAIHAASPRAAAPFVAINCAAVPATLLESELFGHAKGAFTDARADRKGLFVQADGGTLFLDEIGEMPTEMQAKLLRALQEHTVRPVGANIDIPFDTRIVAATNKNLDAEVAEKHFREDLYYRINVVSIDLPPLRQRGNDVLGLAAHFLERHAGRTGRHLSLSPSVAEKLVAYDWPGNVRELENCIERAAALARFDELTVDDLPKKLQAYHEPAAPPSTTETVELQSLDDFEERYIKRVLALLEGNMSRAARVLGLDRRTLYRRVERYQHSNTRTTAREIGPR